MIYENQTIDTDIWVYFIGDEKQKKKEIKEIHINSIITLDTS